MYFIWIFKNQIFHYTRYTTPKHVTSLRGSFPHHCVRAIQLLSKKCCSGGEPLATLSPIWLVRDLNLRPPAPETNALPLDQQAVFIRPAVLFKASNKFVVYNCTPYIFVTVAHSVQFVSPRIEEPLHFRRYFWLYQIASDDFYRSRVVTRGSARNIFFNVNAKTKNTCS